MPRPPSRCSSAGSRSPPTTPTCGPTGPPRWSRSGSFPRRLADARRAAAGAPERAFLQDLVGQVLAASGESPGALAAFAAAARLEPEDPGHALGEVDALLALGRQGDAYGRLAALRSRFPPDRLRPDLGARAAAAGCFAP